LTGQPGLAVVSFPSAEAFAAWLDAEHGQSPGIWLKIAKKDAGVPTVSYDEAVDVALCFGWIDGQKRGLDGQYWLQRFTPRQPRSRWSKINCARADRLLEAGQLRPRGLAEVEAAKADGRWATAYAGQRAATVPADLQAVLDTDPVAQDFFTTISSQNRYAIIYRVGDAKRPETRAARIAKYVAMLHEHQTGPRSARTAANGPMCWSGQSTGPAHVGRVGAGSARDALASRRGAGSGTRARGRRR
jgi:uncharacterized protein YdeI (YjbR/CyaY-like superfamily)